MIHHGHVIDVCRKLAADGVRVQCVVTSPPYWALRAYGTEPQIWGGEPDCEHVWGDVLPRAGNEYRNDKGQLRCNIERKERIADGLEQATSGQFCQRCGAWLGELGLEPTPELYVEHLVSVFAAVRDVMADDAVLWVNLSDTYIGGGRGYSGNNQSLSDKQKTNAGTIHMPKVNWDAVAAKPGDLACVPDMFVLAMRANGWYYRSRIVWAKRSPMPESVNGVRWERCKRKVGDSAAREIQGKNRGSYSTISKLRGNVCTENGEVRPLPIWEECAGCDKCRDTGGYVLRRGRWRPTRSHEYIFMFTKSHDYFCNAEAAKERAVWKLWLERAPGLRNLWDVWSFTSKNDFAVGEHYATFPLELPRRCILASTSPKGHCPKCGARWAPVIRFQHVAITAGLADRKRRDGQDRLAKARGKTGWQGKNVARESDVVGYRPTCTCPEAANPAPDIVLDPFAGSGTTLLVARKLGLQAIGIELQQAYIDIARKRFAKELGLLAHNPSPVDVSMQG